MAAYSLVLVLALSGDGGDGGDARARPLSPFERKVSRLVEGTKPKAAEEPRDVVSFRQAHVRSVRCKERRCDIVYAVGLPGTGRILEDQRRMWERLFTRTSVLEASMTVTRDAAAGGVPAKAGEETPTGAPLVRTTCDRSKRRNVKWRSARGAEILASICEVDGFDQGKIHGQEPVAPDDPAGKSPDLPEQGE